MEKIFELTKNAQQITEQLCGNIKGGLITPDAANKQINDAWNLVFQRMEIYEKSEKIVVLVPTELRISEVAAEFSLQFSDYEPVAHETGFACGAKWMKKQLIPIKEEHGQ